MSRRKNFKQKQALALNPSAQAATKTVALSVTPYAMLPLGAMLLAGSMGAMAQEADASKAKTLAPVAVKEQAEGKDSIRATTTTIGKGQQELRNIPQSITVITEKLITDRNYDTVKDVLRHTGGVSFLAAEGGEEDIRMRGFNLQSTGDVFVDGIRDPAFYERDTFNDDRVEILRGSASMLFGRGSTGGAVNQVNKQPLLKDASEVNLTLGNSKYRRATGDFNIKTADDAALRLNLMTNTADNNGAGSSIDKQGLAAAYRFGIGSSDEFSAGLYYLNNKNGMNYGMPWILPFAGATVAQTGLNTKLDPDAYYGMASDYNNTKAAYVSFSHLHRFSPDSELKTSVRKGDYNRDMRASLIRVPAVPAVGTTPARAVTLDTFNPSTVMTRTLQAKVQQMDNLYVQSDFSSKFEALGMGHEVLAGIDFAQEKRTVRGVLSVAQGGVTNTKPSTTAGTPNDGASFNEDSRIYRPSNGFESNGVGIYAQDLVQISPHWKLLGGLRYDRMTGDYDTFAPATGATTGTYKMKIGEWSKRLGAMYQPTPLHSFHFSYGTSFNTSGDAYSLSASNQNIPPESSQNLELGARIDSADKRFSTRLAVFRSTKLHERNTDPLITSLITLSGKRHASGFEADVSGLVTSEWEVFGSYVWIPSAKIDVGVPGSEGQGTRPSLTPEHSGTVWTTYQITPKLRLGGGVNFRSKQTPLRNPGFSAPSYTTLDLLAEYAVIEDKFIIKANVINATNKLYADALYPAFYVPGAGRTMQVTAKLKF